MEITDRGFFPCGPEVELKDKKQNAFRCMSFKDYQTHDRNDTRMLNAHIALVNILKKNNSHYEKQFLKKCPWYKRWFKKCPITPQPK